MESPNDKKPLPPGTMGWPIIGETFQFLKKGSAFYAEKFKQYGNIFKTNILGASTIRVTGSDNLTTMIDREPDQLVMKWPKAVNLLMGAKSLPTVVGDTHPPLKKSLQRAFTPTRLADYFPCVQQHIRAHLKKWMDEDKDVLGYPSCEDLIADIMLEVVLGCRKEDDKDGRVRAAFRDVNHNLFTIPVRLPGFGFNTAYKAREVILDFVQSRMSGSESEKDYVCMMDILLTLHGDREHMDEEEVKDNAIGLLLAGSASTSGAMTCLLLLLGTYPDVLEKVREELRSAGLFGKDADADLSYDMLQRLSYVQSVEKESLRYLPPVGGCFRKAENDMELDNYHIPKDWTIIYSIRDTQGLASKLIPDGNLFRPSRWLEKDENGDGLNLSSCQYIPFGAGPRMCLGRQLARMVLHTFIVELALTARWEVRNPDCPLVHLPITKPSDDMPVKFHHFCMEDQ